MFLVFTLLAKNTHVVSHSVDPQYRTVCRRPGSTTDCPEALEPQRQRSQCATYFLACSAEMGAWSINFFGGESLHSNYLEGPN